MSDNYAWAKRKPWLTISRVQVDCCGHLERIFWLKYSRKKKTSFQNLPPPDSSYREDGKS